MTAPVQARRLMIYLGESDTWRGRSLYMSILETLRKGEIAGATVTRAVAGFGAHSRIRTQAIEALSMDLPIVISIVDSPANIERAVTLVAPMVREGLITVEDVEIIKYSHRYLQPLPADRPVGDVMTRQVTAISPDTSARQIVELLLGKLFKAVPVINAERKVVGIITSSDLLRHAGMPARLAVGERLDEADLRAFLAGVHQEKTAADIMTAPVVTVQDDEALGHVVQKLLQHGLKRMPVVDAEGRLAGMVSRLDVLRAVAGDGEGQPERAPVPHAGQTIGEIKRAPVWAVHVNDDLMDVLDRLLQSDAKRVIVLDEQDRPIGIITDGDIVARVSPAARPNILRALAEKVLETGVTRGETTAAQLMSEAVLTAPPDLPVTEAVALLLRQGRKRLVVVDSDGRAVGLVDRQTLLAASINLGGAVE